MLICCTSKGSYGGEVVLRREDFQVLLQRSRDDCLLCRCTGGQLAVNVGYFC